MSDLLLALLPAIALALVFVGYCLFDLTRSDVKLLPRWGWMLIIFCSIPLGGILYLAAGKKHS